MGPPVFEPHELPSLETQARDDAVDIALRIGRLTATLANHAALLLALREL